MGRQHVPELVPEKRLPAGPAMSRCVDLESQRWLHPEEVLRYLDVSSGLSAEMERGNSLEKESTTRCQELSAHDSGKEGDGIREQAEKGSEVKDKGVQWMQDAAAVLPSRVTSEGTDERSKGQMWRESSYDFGQEAFCDSRAKGGACVKKRTKSFDFGVAHQDPSSNVIGEFLRRQQISGELTFDCEGEVEEVQDWARSHNPLKTLCEEQGPASSSSSSSLEHLVDVHQFTSSVADVEAAKVQMEKKGSSIRRDERATFGVLQETTAMMSPCAPSRRSDGSGSGGVFSETVLKSSSRAFAGNVSRLKSRSRLADPPRPSGVSGNLGGRSGARPRSGQQQRSGQVVMKSGKHSTQRSGMLGKVEEEEEDPFKDADLPDKYKRRHKWGFWAVLEWLAFVLIIGALVCSLTIPSLKKKDGLGLELWKWSLVVLVVFCGRLISGWIILVIVFFIERNFLLRKKVLYFVYGLRKSVMNCLWLAWVLLAWHFILDPKVKVRSSTDSKTLKYVTRGLVCLLIGALLMLLKTFLIKVLASSFHVSHYFERIQESLFSQHLLETLSGPPMVELEEVYMEEKKLAEEVAGLKRAGATASGLPQVSASQPFARTSSGLGRSRRLSTDPNAKKGGKGEEEAIDMAHLNRLSPKNVSAWNMKRLVNFVRQTRISTLAQTLDETAAKEMDQGGDIDSEWQAKAASKQIFRNVAKPGSKFIENEDLLRFMSEADAIRAFALFDEGSETGKISKQALKSWVISVYRERRALALSLNDTKTAVNKLHRIIDCAAVVIIIVIWLLVLGIATTQLLLFLSSQLLLIVFIFGNTCKTVFEAIIFLFVMHPFDVGDRCVVDGVQMVVEEMNILTTVFLRYDNEKIWYPNSMLATKPIGNFFRSPNMGDSIEFQISASTPLEKITLLKERVAGHIKSSSHHWQEKHVIFVKDIVDMNRMTMILGLAHTMNHQDAGERWVRRSEMLLELRRILQDLAIEYRLLPQEVHLTNYPKSSVF